MKTCPVCKESKEEADFSKNKTAHDGLQSHCKICQNKALKMIQETLRQADRFCFACQTTLPFHQFGKKRKSISEGWICKTCALASKKAYNASFRADETHQLKNKERCKEWRKAGNKTIRPEGYQERMNTKTKEKYHTDPEYRQKILDEATEYRENRTPEQKEHKAVYQKEYSKKYMQKYKELFGESYGWSYAKKRREVDPDFAENLRTYRQNYKMKEYEKKIQNGETISTLEENQKIDPIVIRRLHFWQNNRCYFCHKKSRELWAEHIIPRIIRPDLVRDPQNIVLSCKTCNTKRQEKFFHIEWRPQTIEPLPQEDYFVTYNTIIRDLSEDSIKAEREDYGFRIFGKKERKLYILSTFACGERNPYSNKFAVRWKKQFPNSLILFDHEWYGKTPNVINMLKSKIDLSETIYARKTIPALIDASDARDFLETYHVMGYKSATIYIGLVDPHNKELVGVGAFQKKNKIYDNVRLAFKGHVPGGMSKIISFLWNNCERIPIISYVDSRYADGSGHDTVGFKHLGMTPVSHRWVFPNKVRHYRYLNNDRKMFRNLLHVNCDYSLEDNIKMNGVFPVYVPPLHKIYLLPT